MNIIHIRSLTEIGSQALKQHLKEKKQESWKNRALFKTICDESVYSEEPFTLKWVLKHRYFSKEATKPIIIDAMLQNNAVLDVDYVIEDGK
jgi:hypothetical protein